MAQLPKTNPLQLFFDPLEGLSRVDCSFLLPVNDIVFSEQDNFLIGVIIGDQFFGTHEVRWYE